MSSNSGSEVEIKFRFRDKSTIESRLRELNFREKTPLTHEFNTIFDRPTGELRSRGELLRLREYGGKWKLTFKGRSVDGPHKSRAESETVVEDGQSMQSILLALGFEPKFRYEKLRSEWTDGTGDVVIDLTPIGNLAEIEGPPEWIDAIADKLHVSHEQYITKSYATLFQDWKNETGSSAEHMTFEECGTDFPKV